MHYRNGREAKNGDQIVSIGSTWIGGKEKPIINAIGILYEAVPGNDYCNGKIAPTTGGVVSVACLCDCLHIDDLMILLTEKGLDKRPNGK